MATVQLSFAQALQRASAAYEAGDLAEAERLCGAILAAKGDHFDANHLLAIVQSRTGRAEDALQSYDRALALDPHNAAVLGNRGNVLHQLGREEEALACYEEALRLEAGNPETFVNRAAALRGLGRLEDALASCDQAIALRPDHAAAHYSRGNALSSLKRLEEAVASYERATALSPDHAKAWARRARALLELGRFEEALASCEEALALARAGDLVEALSDRCNALMELKRTEEALESFDRLIAVAPELPEGHNNRGNALLALKRPGDALASYERAIALAPEFAVAHFNRGNALSALREPQAAVESFDRALALNPDISEAHNNRGNALMELKRLEEAVASYDRAIAVNSASADAWYNRGRALKDLQRIEEALASQDQALALKPSHPYAFGEAIDCVIKVGDWKRRAAAADELKAHVQGDLSVISPFAVMGYSDDAMLIRRCAEHYNRDRVAAVPAPAWSPEIWRNERIKVAYLSHDFRNHPVSHLTAGLFELHDRARFEVIGISFGPDDGSEVRARLVRAFDRFHDVRAKSDLEAAQLLRDARVDIAVDLAGYTFGQRLGILARRAAPIQASWLGYAGTLGSPYIDYIIGDPIVLPFEAQPAYAERIVQLPDSFLVNDRKRAIAAPSLPSPASGGGKGGGRAEAGLPAEGFVFCAFNNNWKITPQVFDVWMRLLRAVPKSVLWLSPQIAAAERNLRQEAAARAVDPARLIFARRAERIEDHLARLARADLFLDTLPYNAHATAADALWVGLPVLTCLGRSFAGRVAASLLTAVGLGELATEDLAEYETLALRLATDPALLRDTRTRLERNRTTHPLSDTDRFRRHIEAAYTRMWETWQRGEPPQSFAVAPLDPGDGPVARMEPQGRLRPSSTGHGVIREAVPHYADAPCGLRHDGEDAAALNGRGNALFAQRRFEEALACYAQAIAQKGDFAEAHNNRGNALAELRRTEEAVASYDRAIALKPELAKAHFNRGNALLKLKRFADALASYRAALAQDPGHRFALSGWADCALQLCDWKEQDAVRPQVCRHVAERRSVVYPFVLLGYCDDEALQLQCAKSFVQDRIAASPAPKLNVRASRSGKIRLAYLSADFRRHATAYLMAELFERHDRSKFELIGVSFGPDDKSEMRMRLSEAFDAFHDVGNRSDAEAAELIRNLGVDIAVDLKGHTGGSRIGILAPRPAPIQVSYLGYPGTTGADFIDYILADRRVLPFAAQEFYTEKIVHLPDCYQVNDSGRPIAAPFPASGEGKGGGRAEAALPDDAFVFCCFNGNWKITPALFDIWMRLLRKVEGSVLWLMADNEPAAANLRREARARDVDPARLVFAERLALPQHLARHRLADLFLDTLPVNAHTTASDALWAGLPLLTCRGRSFAGRVAASLLDAVGLGELVAGNLAEYEAQALRLATDPAALRGLRERLDRNRTTQPLFDTERFRRHIEAAYARMWEMRQRGEPPESFAVTPLDGAG